MDRYLAPSRAFLTSALLFISMLAWGCAPGDAGPTVLTADMPLHLEEHIGDATIVGSEVPEDLLQPVEWRFDEPRPGWTTPRPFPVGIRPGAVSRTDDALRVSLGPSNAETNGRWLVGGAYVDVPKWDHRDWAHVLIRARSSGPGTMVLGFNVWDRARVPDEGRLWLIPYETFASPTRLVGDGTVQTYQLPLEPGTAWDESIEQLGFWIRTDGPAEVEILSITMVPMEAAYADIPAGARQVERDNRYRSALFVHTPARIEYRVHVPEGGRLDTGLGTLSSEPPITFRVSVGANGGQAETLLEESYGDGDLWAQRSVDLSAFEGQTVTLALEADAETPGTVALWAVPTLSGSRDAGRPNVVFYIIDGGSAELMSVYGYNRRTTPNLERLATEGAVFERAYSNASWTVPSTVSFMTGLLEGAWPAAPGSYLSDQAVTMAEHMHRGGYQTGVFTATPYAGKMYGLDQGVDFLWEEPWNNESSAWLHRAFLEWRQAYPGQPYWAHFQTVDAHRPWSSVIGFTGLFSSADARQRLEDWGGRLEAAGWRPRGPRGSDLSKWPQAELREFFKRAGVDLTEYVNTQRALYDEGMAHNDYQIGRLVNRIKAAGEWDNTIFILAADHAHGNAGVHESLLRGAPYVYEEAIFSPWRSHIPMIVIWPARIAAGQRFSQPVSMIDMLPTILDLAGLPEPEITQGQSLAPLLLGQEGWEPRPVIFSSDGRSEVVDGRWGASLLEEREPHPPEENGREARLLLFDLLNDPFLSHSLHEERPDLVEK
ncbi:MAG: sulfatase, partial [Gemmatimonadetes bacterium]|nr:sulfatase [Gemmatimonadota bacterium]